MSNKYQQSNHILSSKNDQSTPQKKSTNPIQGSKTSKSSYVNRRTVLSTLGSGLVGSMLPSSFLSPSAHAQSSMSQDPRFLIVVTCAGGGSIIDSVLAVRDSESEYDNLNTFPDAQVQSVDGSPFRAV